MRACVRVTPVDFPNEALPPLPFFTRPFHPFLPPSLSPTLATLASFPYAADPVDFHDMISRGADRFGPR